MLRLRILVVIAALAASVALHAQQGTPYLLPPSIPATPPFNEYEKGEPLVRSVEFLLAEAMSREDQDLVANAESSIGERVRLDDLDFNHGTWTYQQIACTAFPNHLLVRFARNQGANDISMFSVSIPRNNEGRLRIIPIYRRGYSLFSPAPRGPRTIAAFNHMRKEEQYSKSPDWAASGLCYAALTGANPQVGRALRDSGVQPSPLAPLPVLQVRADGGAEIFFEDALARPRPLQWSLTFDRKGQLLKAQQGRSPMPDPREVLPAPLTPLRTLPTPVDPPLPTSSK